MAACLRILYMYAPKGTDCSEVVRRKAASELLGGCAGGRTVADRPSSAPVGSAMCDR